MDIRVENLSFGYIEARPVLSGISLASINQETIAIVGASGAGKSTLLRLLCGILPSKKTQFVHGNIAIGSLSPAAYCKTGQVGFMFQEANLLPNLTVRENIELPLKIKRQKNPAHIDLLLQTVGLTAFSDYLPAQLSGGMKTRVALARTFSTKPQLLLLDEPFASLDIRWCFSLYKELEMLRQSYLPQVVIVTHDIQEALLLANHIYVFGTEGKILKKVEVRKNLPRVFENNLIRGLQDEYEEIQNAIMQNK